MKLKSCVGSFFRFCDLFSISQFIRYKKQGQFKTVSGGVASLLVVSIFFALFLNVAVATINRSIINWSQQTSYSNQPTPTQVNMSTSNFMFMLTVIGLNLNDPSVRYFDINLYAKLDGQNGAPLTSVKANLEPCTKQHFYINQQTRSIYDQMPASQWLCPPLNFSQQLFGKFTSKQMSFIEVDVSKCTPSLTDPRPCVNESNIDYMIQNYGPLNVGFFYLNPMINAGKADYLNYYLESRNWISFTKRLGAMALAYVEDYQIDTDQSLLPFTQNSVDAGVAIPELFQMVSYEVASDNRYAAFLVLKSSVQKTYTRSFNKVDQFFSYVGGLVGTILGLMLFMGNFTSMAFALDLSQMLFKYKEDEDANFKSFNLFTYIGLIPYKIGKCFKQCKNWKEMRKRENCVKQVQRQLDISLIVRKVNFLEQIIEGMLGEQEYKLQHKYKHEVLSRIKLRRKLYSTPRNVMDGQEESSSESESSQDQKDVSQKEAIMENSKITHLQYTKAKIHSQQQLGNQLQPNNSYFVENEADKQTSLQNVQKVRLRKYNGIVHATPGQQIIQDFNQQNQNNQPQKDPNTISPHPKGERFKYESY